MEYKIIKDCDLVFAHCGLLRRKKIMRIIATVTAWWSGDCKMDVPKGVMLAGCVSDIYDVEGGKNVVTDEVISVEQIPPSMIDIHLSHEIYQTQKKAMEIIHRLTCPGFMFMTADGERYLMPLKPGDKADWREPTDRVMVNMINEMYKRKRGA